MSGSRTLKSTGATIAGYQLKASVGTGAHTAVVRAIHSRTGREVAIKLLKRRNLSEKEFDKLTARLRREIEIIGQLSHTNIVALIEGGFDPEADCHYVVYEYLRGMSLEAHIARYGPLQAAEAMRLMGQVLDALVFSHSRGIVHRDVKPSNIMLRVMGSSIDACLLDFGLSKLMDGAAQLTPDISFAQEIIGTPSYSAPEQLRGEPATSWSDLYSWAMVYCECVTGERMVSGSLYDVLSAQLGPAALQIPEAVLLHPIGAFIRKLLSKNPQKRSINLPLLQKLTAISQAEALELPIPHEALFRQVHVLAIVHPQTSARASSPDEQSKVMQAIEVMINESGGHICSSSPERVVAVFGYFYVRRDEAIRASACAMKLERAYRGSGVGLESIRLHGQSPDPELLRESEQRALTLAAFARGGRVLASKPIAPYLADYFSLKASDELDAFEITGQLDSGLESPDGDTAFVGRDTELNVLIDGLNRTINGERSGVWVSGDPGIGKSRLVYEFRMKAVARGIRCCTISCSRARSIDGSQPVIECLDRLLLRNDDLSPEERAHCAASLANATSNDAGVDYGNAARTLADVFIRLGMQQPLVLIVENVQWLSTAALLWLRETADRSTDSKVFLILSSRSREETHPSLQALPWVNHLQLMPLSMDDTNNLIRRCFVDKTAATDQLVERLTMYSGGIPLYALELVRSRSTYDAHPAEGEEDSIRKRSVFSEAVIARVESLGEASGALKLAAVCGEVVDLDLLAGIYPFDEPLLIRHLSELERALFLRPGSVAGRKVRFNHELVRDVLYSATHIDTRRDLHRAIARELEQPALGRTRRNLEEMASHLEMGGDSLRAIDCWQRAGIEAHKELAFADADRCLQQALDLTKMLDPGSDRDRVQLRLMLDLASVVGQSTGFGSIRTESILIGAEELSRRLGDDLPFLRLLHNLARLRQSQGQFRESLRISGRLIAIAETTGETSILQAGLLTQAFTLTYLGDFDSAADCLQRCIDLVKRIGESGEELALSSRAWFAWVDFSRGREKESLDALRELIDSVRGREGSVPYFLIQSVRADIAWRQGRFEQTQAAASETVAHSLRQPFWHAIGLMLLGAAWVGGGQHERGLSTCKVGLEQMLMTGSRHGLTQWYWLIADLHRLVGRLDEAERYLAMAGAHQAATEEAMYSAPLSLLRLKIAAGRST